MTRSPRRQGESGIYHVCARGVSRTMLFEDDEDRKVFINELRSQQLESNAKLYAWCLMDNHYHLLVELDLANLATMMKAINSSYALYFNLRHDRVGHLFQGRFKSEPVDGDAYFLTVLRYIHQNPVKARITKTCDYPWSSYREYLGLADLDGLADTAFALDMLGGPEGFVSFHAQLDLKASCCDVDRSRRLVNDESALAVARAVLGDIPVEAVVGLDRAARNKAIRMLRMANLSVRQIERMTGVSRGIIARVTPES